HAARRLSVVFLHAAVRQHARREEQILEVRGGLGHDLVGVVDEDDDDAHRALQWRSSRRGGSNGLGARAGGEVFRREDGAVVEAWPAWLARRPEKRRG